MAEMRHNSLGSISTAKKVEISEKPKMAENDLRSLIDLGCVRDSITIGNMTFTMKTLNVSERLSLTSALGENPDNQKLFDFNTQILAMSIESVNGELFENFHPDKGENPLSLKKQLLLNMQPQVISKLLEFYTKITERGDAQFSTEQIKNL